MENLPFQPLWGFHNPHLQTVLAGLVRPAAIIPPSKEQLIHVGKSDALCCIISTPPNWKEKDKTVVLIHGLAGSQYSTYMTRLNNKLYEKGIRAVCVNLRNSGKGAGLSRLPYHSGNSSDLLAVLEWLKLNSPASPIDLVGFSLGGNIVLKLLGELGERGPEFVHFAIAVCPPLDLLHTVKTLSKGFNKVYERYYLYFLHKQSAEWIRGHKIRTLYDYDTYVTAALWGYSDAEEYYKTCSSLIFLPTIHCPCYVLLSADDPIIDYKIVQEQLNGNIKFWLSSHGGHMGFFSRRLEKHGHFWLDYIILQWLDKV